MNIRPEASGTLVIKLAFVVFCTGFVVPSHAVPLSFSEVNLLAGAPGDIRDIETADMNNDGVKDLVVAGSNGLFWLNSIEPQGLQAISYEATSDICLADVDRNGNLDVLRPTSIGAYWFRNAGNGVFIQSKHIPFNWGGFSGPSELITADANANGLVEIVVVYSRNGNRRRSVHMYEITGSDSLSWPFITMTVSLEQDGKFFMHDVDSDGLSEVVGRIENSTSWDRSSLGDSAVEANFLAEGRPQCEPADIDGDGNSDWLIMRSTGLHSLQMDGTLPGELTQISEDTQIKSAIFVDFDTDGDIDILTDSMANNAPIWFANDGSGTFEHRDPLITDCYSHVEFIAASENSDPIIYYAKPIISRKNVERILAIDDLDGNGYVDLGTTFGIRVAYNQGNAVFDPVIGIPNDSLSTPKENLQISIFTQCHLGDDTSVSERNLFPCCRVAKLMVFTKQHSMKP